MKKIIFPCVVLGIYSIAYAEQPKLEQYTQLTFYEFASLDTWPIDHVNEFRKALNEKYYPLPRTVSEKATTLLSLSRNICQNSNLSDSNTSDYGTGMKREDCNLQLKSITDKIEEEKKSIPSKTFNEYKKMTIEELNRLSHYNQAEFLEYVKSEYGPTVSVNISSALYGFGQLVCEKDGEVYKNATPKQRKELRGVCETRLDKVLSEYE